MQKRRKKKGNSRLTHLQAFARTRFKEWLKDDILLHSLERKPVRHYEPVFVIDIFVVDLSRHSDIKYGAFDMMITPYAKILSKGHLVGTDYDDIDVGDVVLLRDQMATQEINESYDKYMAEIDKGRIEEMMDAPTPYMRAIWGWFGNGYHYAVDKEAYLLDPKMVTMDLKELQFYKGPWTFCIPQSEIKHKPKYAFGVQVNDDESFEEKSE